MKPTDKRTEDFFDYISNIYDIPREEFSLVKEQINAIITKHSRHMSWKDRVESTIRLQHDTKKLKGVPMMKNPPPKPKTQNH